MLDPLETILRQCAEAAPDPWYPSGYAQANGMKRDDLDPHLDQLRMAGLIHLTDWVQGQGQGYALTQEGKRILKSPRELARLRAGKLDISRSVLQEPPHPADRPMTALERGDQIRAAFLYPSPPIVSFTLIFLNIAWFLPEILLSMRYQLPLNEFLVGYARQPAQQFILNRVLTETGALSGIYIVQGEWWRLLSCCFVHVGLLHLGVNMWALYAVGPFFEQLWGRGRFLVLYLIAGLGGSCAMVITNPLTLGAGASGALWGILTAHAIWILFNRRYLPASIASRMLRQIVFILIINVVITYSVPNISASAHFGGGAVGALSALLLNYHRYAGSLQRRLALLGLIAIPVLCVSAVAEAERVDPRWQELRIGHMADADRRTVLVYQKQWEVLQKMNEAELTPDVMEQLIAPCRQARQQLEAAVEILRQTGPYHDQKVERRRLRALMDEEERLQGWKDTELRWQKKARSAKRGAQSAKRSALRAVGSTAKHFGMTILVRAPSQSATLAASCPVH